MLIWKVIQANPGITREEIWERVEDGIPEGYALRRTGRTAKGPRLPVDDPAGSLRAARRFVFGRALAKMKEWNSIARDGDSFHVVRELQYRGDPDAIDIDGTKAANHMALAEALRVIEKMLAKGSPDRKYGPAFVGGRKEYAANMLIVKTLRAIGSSGNAPDERI